MNENEAGAVGKLLGGRYRLLRLIGHGGTGHVYEATDEQTPGTRMAIKLLHAQYDDHEDMRARLMREAKLAEEIRSPHVARVFGAGMNREQRGWIIFELLLGESLDVRLRRERQLPFQDVAWIIEHTLLGLEAAHQIGVVHRDIKPGNLFLEAGPRLRVLDFGIAKRLRRDTATTSGLTNIGDVLGTPSYMSPEQLEDSKDIDARTDIYSVALVAFRILAGRLPFEHQELSAMREMKRLGAIASLAQTSRITWPVAVETWLQRAAAARREDRFESARAALTDWHRACEAMKEHVAMAASPDGSCEDTDLAPPSSR